MAPSVVDMILPEVMRAFSSVPRRGAETGGLLLGRITTLAPLDISVSRVVTIPTEHRYGPSFQLSDKDRQHVKALVEQSRQGDEQVVGYYRSNTRGEFKVADDDVALLQNEIGEAKILLLIQPTATRGCTAAFFRPEQPDSPIIPPFPFSRLAAAPKPDVAFLDAPPVEPEGLVVPESRPQPQEAYREAAIPAPVNLARSSWQPLWWGLLTGLLLGALGAGVAYQMGKQQARQEIGPATLGLTAAFEGNAVRVRWGRQTYPLQVAQGGYLEILDGGLSSRVMLSPSQLRIGEAVYNNRSRNLQIRLQVMTGPASLTADTYKLE